MAPTPESSIIDANNNQTDLITCESEASIDMRNILASHQVIVENRILGCGCFSKVKYGFYKKTQTAVAIKQIDYRAKTDFVNRFLPRELKIVRLLDHPTIIKCYDIIKTPEYVCLVEEFAQNGDLLHKIKAEKCISDMESKFMFRQMMEGLKYLEELNIVHRDLKCENIFLDKCGNLKIGDFGFARHLPQGVTSNTFCGSRAYVALEILRATMYTGHAVDIWSAGVILYIMLTGCMPFNERKPKEMVLLQMKRRISYPRNSTVSSAARELIYEMLHPDPSLRITNHQIITSAWLKDTKFEVRQPAEGKSERSSKSLTEEIGEE
uniref:Protein kinase domain-containing protein n=1 Tax=Rhabditophanes sp. KR3021 TaxID=114890 RepID=A0AC35UFH8_9BILA